MRGLTPAGGNHDTNGAFMAAVLGRRTCLAPSRSIAAAFATFVASEAIDADDEQARLTTMNVASAEFLVIFEIRTANTYQPGRASE